MYHTVVLYSYELQPKSRSYLKSPDLGEVSNKIAEYFFACLMPSDQNSNKSLGKKE